MKQINSSASVLFRREKGKIKYLLLHYPQRHWGFPKGTIEKGENKKQTIKREIKEETGISKFEFIDNFEEKIEYIFRQDNEILHKNVTFFLVETKEKDVKLSHEHTDFKWLLFKDAFEQLSYKNTKEILKKADEFISKNLVSKRI